MSVGVPSYAVCHVMLVFHYRLFVYVSIGVCLCVYWCSVISGLSLCLLVFCHTLFGYVSIDVPTYAFGYVSIDVPTYAFGSVSIDVPTYAFGYVSIDVLSYAVWLCVCYDR